MPLVPSRLSQALRKSSQGTDEITIGSKMRNGDIKGATMADVAKLIEGVRYLVRGWIPYGMVTGVIAEPGTGKSAFALWLARTVMTGSTWFTGAKGPAKGYVLWCPTESDMAVTLQRMVDWKISMDKLLLPFGDDPLKSVNLTNKEHLQRMEQLINKHRTKLVVVDSLRGAHDSDENNSRVSTIMQGLSGIAERTKASVVLVHHTKKLMLEEEPTANSSRGSNAIIAMMRSLIGIDRPDPTKPKWCRLRILKENLGIAPDPIGFRIDDQGLHFGDSPRRPPKANEKDKAAEWLKSRLIPGKWIPAKTLLEEAAELGYSRNAVQRAREEMGIIKSHGIREIKGVSEWTIPVD